MTKRRNPSKPPRRYWTAAELKRVAKLYPDHPTKEIAKEIGRTVLSTYQAAQKLGLTKTAEFRKSYCFQKGSQIGAQSRFVKGQTPANKGLRRPGYSAGRGRMQETQFKKGVRSGIAAKNWKPIGTIVTDDEGYLRIKVREYVYGKEHSGMGNTKVWPMYNRYLWEKHKGPIPPKHLVKFIDGNRANCVIENLELISKADNARRNAMWNRYPPELSSAIMLNGALKRKIRSKANGKEQDQRPEGSPVRDARSVEGQRPADGPGPRENDQRRRTDHHQRRQG